MGIGKGRCTSARWSWVTGCRSSPVDPVRSTQTQGDPFSLQSFHAGWTAQGRGGIAASMDIPVLAWPS